MKPLYFRDLSDKLKVQYMKAWDQGKMAKLNTKLKREEDITVGFICDPLELKDV